MFDLNNRIMNDIYGRELELNKIENHFENILRGQSSSCFVTGEAGSGKTHLLSHVALRLINKNAKYIYAKFDHHSSNSLTIIEKIINQLTNIVLTEPDEKLNSIKAKLNKHLKDSFPLITSICPETEKLIGKSKIFKIDDYYKHEYMFLKTFYTFIGILSEEIFPIVIHIDDFQWADDAFVKIVNGTGKHINSVNIYLIFSLRGEHKANTPLESIKEFLDSGIDTLYISLKRLNYENSVDYIKSCLKSPISKEDIVLEKIYRATMGNPYSLKNLLEKINKNSGLYYDNKDHIWRLEEAFLDNNKLSENVKESIINQVIACNDNEMYLLEILVCLGSNLGFHLIDLILENESIDLPNTLSELCSSGFLIKKQSVLSSKEVTYNFAHDIILDTIFNRMTLLERQTIHHLIVKRLSRFFDNQKSSKYVLLTAHQILQCRDLIIHEDDLDIYINILYIAGIYSKENTMIAEAHQFFELCLNLLNENKSTIKQNFKIKVMTELAECKFIFGKIEDSISLFEYINSKLEGKEDIIELKKKMVILYTSTASSSKVMQICKEILDLLDFELNTKNIKLNTIKEIINFKYLFSKKQIKKITGLSTSKDYHIKEVGQTLIRMIAIANLTDDDLFVLLILKLCNYSARYGSSENSLPAYAAGSYLLNSYLGKEELALELTRKTEVLLEHSEDNRIKCMTYFILGNFVKHWQVSSAIAIDYLIQAIEFGIMAGDLQYAEYSFASMIEMTYASGMPLLEVKDYIHKIDGYDNKIKNDIVNITINMLEYHISKLNSSESNRIASIQLENHDIMQSLTFDYYTLHRQYLLGDIKYCSKLLKKFDKQKNMYNGYYLQVDLEFFLTLVRFDIHNSLVGNEKNKNKRMLKKSLQKFTHWVKYSKDNHWGRYTILKARYNELFNNTLGSDELYEKGINFSTNRKQFIVAAVGNLLASKYHEKNKRFSNMYLTEAIKTINIWGAFHIANTISKRENIAIMDNLYIHTEDKLQPSKNETKIEDPEQDNITDMKIDTKKFELLNLDQSLIHLLEHLLKNTKGSYGAIFIEDANHAFMTHELSNNKALKFENPLILEKVDSVSCKIVRYVSRTKNEVLISENSLSSFFSYDEYLKGKSEYSILCVPLLYMNILSGIVYLEANINNAFSEGLIEDIKYYSSMLAAKKLSKQQGLMFDMTKEIPLTKRELEVFKLIIKGITNKQVGERLNISLSTVKTHLINIYSKLHIKNRVEAVEKAKEYRLL